MRREEESLISDAPLLGRRWLGGLIIDELASLVHQESGERRCVFKNSVSLKRNVISRTLRQVKPSQLRFLKQISYVQLYSDLV